MAEHVIRDLEAFDAALAQPRVLLFKHSPICPISATARASGLSTHRCAPRWRCTASSAAWRTRKSWRAAPAILAWESLTRFSRAAPSAPSAADSRQPLGRTMSSSRPA